MRLQLFCFIASVAVLATATDPSALSDQPKANASDNIFELEQLTKANAVLIRTVLIHR